MTARPARSYPLAHRALPPFSATGLASKPGADGVAHGACDYMAALGLTERAGKTRVQSPSYRPSETTASAGRACGNLITKRGDASDASDATPSVLSPPVYVLTIRDAKHAQSKGLRAACLDPAHPIVVVRNAVASLGIRLSSLDSRTLVAAHGDRCIEIRTQIRQSPDENLDRSGASCGWRCESTNGATTIAAYAAYQRREIAADGTGDDAVWGDQSVSSMGTANDTGSSAGHSDTAPSKRRRRAAHGELLRSGDWGNANTVHFATNIDLSDQEQWQTQLTELRKLPAFMHWCGKDDMLRYMRGPVLGVNRVQMYMKVAGCRTPAHQENSNMASVNINCGPGDCVWFAVAYTYWARLEQMCREYGAAAMLP